MVGPDLPGVTCVRRIDLVHPEPDPPGPNGGPQQFAGDELYLAVRQSDGSDVAVRCYARRLRSHRDRHRFEQEVSELRVLAGLPGVLPVLGAGVTSAGHAYVVTPYCPAGSLRDHATAVGRLTAADVRRIGTRVAAALVMIHARGIVHRNLRPATVLIGGCGEPLISGFGLAAPSVSGGDFAPPADAGSDPFRAPEAYLPELMTPLADVFSLGATLYHLLAGSFVARQYPPVENWVGDTLVDLPRVPLALLDIIRTAMAPDPDDRYCTSDALHRALSRTGTALARR